jgi:putative DNA primase/helicase
MVSAAFLERQQDKSKVVINLQNGTFEITQEHTTLRGFESEDFLIYQLPFAYNEAATAPLFMKYLDRVLPSKELQDILSEFIGYIFIKNLKLEKCLLLLGSGANGKSVFFEIINSLLGKENISNLNMGNLNDPNGRAVIVNKLLNYGSELNAHDIRTETLKQLISGEPIECKILFKDKFQCDDYARLMFNCNELPKQVEHNEAFFRRFLIIPFNVTIPENERDPQLADSIINTELSGVFNWVLEGLKRLLINNRFTSSEESKEVLNNYRKESDNVSLYLEESCVTKSTSSGILLNDLYYEYSQFCKECGHRACSNITFSKRLKALGFEFHRKQEGNIVYATRQGFSSSKIIIREEPTFPAFSTSKNQPPFPVYTGENNDDEIWS